MKQKVEIENWDRAQNWKFMHDFAISWYSVTSEVECTKAFIRLVPISAIGDSIL